MDRTMNAVVKKVEHNSLLRFLTIKLAPVLVNVKPAVLVGMSNRRNECNYRELWIKNKTLLISNFGLSYREFKGARQVLFYNPLLLDGVLNKVACKDFLNRFGYFDCICLDDYLELLAERFNSGQFPHEIGVFLGYPLKDVQGFLEHPARKPIRSGRWKVFGEVGPSVHVMNIFRKAETMFGQILKNQRDPMLFVDRLNKHFQKKMLEGLEGNFFD